MAVGDFGDVKGTLEFESDTALEPSIIRISANICAIAYIGPDTTGWIKTVQINANGSIDADVKGSLKFEGVNCASPRIIHVATSIYAIVYTGPDSHGWIKTAQINANGSIEADVKGLKEFDGVACAYPDITHVAGGIFAITYRGTSNYCYVTTVGISPAGVISFDEENVLQVTDVVASASKIRKIGATNKYLITQNRGLDGWAVTVTISDAGEVGEEIVRELEFESTYALTCHPVRVTDNLFAVAYVGAGSDGWIKTVAVTDAGIISIEGMDLEEYDETNSAEMVMIEVGENVFMVAYAQTLVKGIVSSLTINDDGSIDDTLVSTKDFDTTSCYSPVVCHVAGDMFAVAFRNLDTDGFVTAFECETPAAARVGHLMMMGIG